MPYTYQSKTMCPEEICSVIGVQQASLSDAVDYLREEHGIHVEVFLSKNSFTHTKKEKEYEIRVTDENGGNVSKYSTKCYNDCIVEGLRTAVRVCF